MTASLRRRLLRAAVRRWAAVLRIDDRPWDALSRELDHWRGRPAQFWWRDDDAVAATPALDRLLALRADLGVPLALAVIPAQAERSLAEATTASDSIRVLPHGWDHQDHVGTGGNASEFPSSRQPHEVHAQLAAGRARLETLFGERSLRVLVPPFNRIAATLADAVKNAGFLYVSMDRDFLDFPLQSKNVHADLIDWSHGSAVAPAEAVRPLIAALRLRRYGLVSSFEPVGIMTHHLVHTEAVWALAADLLHRLATHPGATFPAIESLFPASGGP